MVKLNSIHQQARIQGGAHPLFFAARVIMTGRGVNFQILQSRMRHSGLIAIATMTWWADTLTIML
jgi:hypothetical protein